MSRPGRALCARCISVIADPDPSLVLDILRTTFEPPRLMKVEPGERWRFIQALAADPSEALNYGVVLHGVELPLLSVSTLHGTPMCAVHLGAYASLSTAEEANR